MRLNYKGGYFEIPKIEPTVVSGVNKNIVVSEEAFKLINEKATRIPVTFSSPEDTEKAYNNPANTITQVNGEKLPGVYTWRYLSKDYVYELYNGNVLYFYIAQQKSRYSDSPVAMVFKNKQSDYGKKKLFAEGWFCWYLTTWEYGSSPSSSVWNESTTVYPYIYMFQTYDDYVYIGTISNGLGPYPKFQFLSGPIAPNSWLYDELFKDNEQPPPAFEGDTNTTKPSGGEGEYNFVSEAVPFSPLPTKSAVDAGFVTLYNPTNDQIKNLAQYLWTSDFTTAVKKLFNDPMDAILNLSFVPVKPLISGLKDVSVGFIPTGVTMNTIGEQYVQFDCGSIDVKEQWGSCLDYSPFTKVSIYLPYIGEKPLDIDDVMNNKIQLIYNIDLLSGSCVAQLYFTNATQPGRVLYTFAGVCATAIPVHGRDFSQLVTAGINLVTAGATAAITGGAAASAVSSLLINSASNISSAKPAIQKSSAIAASSGLLDIQKPYLIFSYPRQSLPTNYKSFQGYPSNITSTLSKLTGYTVIEQIHVENIPCTESERSLIESLLKGGVII